MDNAAIHYLRETRSKYVDHRVKIIYNVPYCCYLNPIEYCFSILKKHLKKHKIMTQDKLIDLTLDYLDDNLTNDIDSAMKYALKIWTNLFK